MSSWKTCCEVVGELVILRIVFVCVVCFRVSTFLEFCFELLRRNRRFVAVIGFRQECGLEDARKRGE